ERRRNRVREPGRVLLRNFAVVDPAVVGQRTNTDPELRPGGRPGLGEGRSARASLSRSRATRTDRIRRRTGGSGPDRTTRNRRRPSRLRLLRVDRSLDSGQPGDREGGGGVLRGDRAPERRSLRRPGRLGLTSKRLLSHDGGLGDLGHEPWLW